MSYTTISTVGTAQFCIDATGDVVSGDRIRFAEAVFTGSHRKPKFAGERIIEAAVVADSYGSEKQQHTFSLVVLESWGVDSIAPGTKTS